MISSAVSRAKAGAAAVLARPSARRWAPDVALTAVVTAVQIVAAYASASWHPVRHGSPGLLAYLLLAVGGLALIGRRKYPVGVLAICLVTALAAQAAGAQFVWLAVIVAFFNAELAHQRLAAVGSLVIGYLTEVLGPFLLHGRVVSVAFALGLLAWFLVLLSAAELWRARNQRVAALEQSRREELARRSMQERVAMARDLHDVLAHSISVINVQANTALHLIDRRPESARDALTTIHEVSRQALGEIRSVLGVLRADAEAAPRSPGPGIDRLAELADTAQSAGIRVDLAEEGAPSSLPSDVSVAAYRIVQEALTNCARHSGGSVAKVLVRYASDALVIEVSDDGRDASGTGRGAPANGAVRAVDGAANGGNGILGMTERAEALGGTLRAGPDPAGGYRVVAELPFCAGTPAAR